MRIIAGKHRGLKLETFEAENIRPTLDRAREGIFNKIQFIIPDSFCLDLFGGTGAISLELLSRGANEVITVDNNDKSCAIIKKNFNNAKEKCNLIKDDYLNVCETLKGKHFDIIFLDPPFACDYGINAINKICELDLLDNDGILIFEHSSERKFDKDYENLKNNLELVDSKKYGYISVDYLKRILI